MECDERTRGIAWQREHRHVAFLSGDRGERRRLAWLDLDASEVDRAVEVPLDDWFEEVARAHACATSCEHDISFGKAASERGNVLVEAI